ncbi:breast cancer type 2 susceptibility protein [Ornithorhynchus anatinus]|uniref:breast cancer type 2 susceptibility protein n=1 Tax=Ornithorhynchus anatinus TaxID=9258 RepID=UPI0010A93F4C|nr:breast cancer type 2 susceptibility protein [Ornithorhynchus anatinus]
MPVEPKERPTFFEIFKARCSNSDLGPISLNWFEELSLEAPPYNSTTSEDPECKTRSCEPNVFKTPQRKPSTYSQLASTPVIFKNQNVTLPADPSPMKGLDQCSIDPRKDDADNKDSQRSHCMTGTKLQQVNDVPSPFSSFLSESPTVLQRLFTTPQKNKPVICGSLFCTPKLTGFQTPRPISESLGVEVDPDMSWSSSLATPPTLSSTVLLAKDDQVSEAKFADGNTIMLQKFLGHGESLRRNGMNTSSGTNVNSETGIMDHELEKILDGSFDDVNSCEDRIEHDSESAWNRSEPQNLEDEVYEAAKDVLPGEGDAHSINYASCKTKEDEGKHFNQIRAAECKDTEHLVENAECAVAHDTEFTSSVAKNKVQQPLESVNDRSSKEEVTSQASEWSQLNLSGFDGTWMEKTPPAHISSLAERLAAKAGGHAASDISLPSTLSPDRAQKVLNIDPLVNTRDDKQCSQPHQDCVLMLKDTTPETFPVASPFQSNRNLMLQKKQDSEKTSEEDFLKSNFLGTNPTDFKDPETPDTRLESHSSLRKDGSRCPPRPDPLAVDSDGNESWPTSDYNPVIWKSTGIISNLKKKTRRFIYAVNSDSSFQEGKTPEHQGSGSPHSSTSSCLEWKSSVDPQTYSRIDPDLLGASARKECLLPEAHGQILSSPSKVMCGIDCPPPENSFSRSTIVCRELEYNEAKTNDEPHSATSFEACDGSEFQQSHFNDPSKRQRVASIKDKAKAAAGLLARKHSEVEFGKIEHTVHSPEANRTSDVNPSTLGLTPSSKDPPLQSSFIIPRAKESFCKKNLESEFRKNHKVSCVKNKASPQLNDIAANNSTGKETEHQTGFSVRILQQAQQRLSGKCKEMTPPSVDKFTESLRDCQEAISEVTVVKPNYGLNKPLHKDTFLYKALASDTDVMDNTGEICESSYSYLEEPVSESNTSAIYAEMEHKEETQELITQNSFSSKEAPEHFQKGSCSLNQALKMSGEVTLPNKDLNCRNSSSLVLKSKGNNGGNPKKWTRTFEHVLNQSVGCGFQTASNKEIKLSENNLKRSKMLFKDIEEQYPNSIFYAESANTSTTVELDNAQESSVQEKKLNQNSSRAFDSKPSSTKPNDFLDNISVVNSENTILPLQPLCIQPDLELKHCLTASQKAEITELSTILEETGSQFEFTQFKHQGSTVENNVIALGKNDEDELVNSNNTSDELKGVTFDDSFIPRVRGGNGKFPKQVETSVSSEDKVNIKQQTLYFQKSNSDRNTFADVLGIKENEFRGFHSALGRKMVVSDVALQKAAKLFSDIEEMSDEATSSEAKSKICSSESHISIVSAFETANDKNDKDIEEKRTKSLYKSPTNVENIVSVAKTENWGENMQNKERNDFPFQRPPEISNLRKSTDCNRSEGKYCVHKEGSGVSSIDQHNAVLKMSNQFLNQENTQADEGLSDLTCLEAVKAEEMSSLNISDKVRDVTCNPEWKQMEGTLSSREPQSFQTARGKKILVSTESLKKAHLLFREECPEEESDVFLFPLHQMENRVINEKMEKYVKEKITTKQSKTPEEAIPGAPENQVMTFQREPNLESERLGEHSIMDFKTASGKNVKISKESLAKVKDIFAEENPTGKQKMSTLQHPETGTSRKRENIPEGFAHTSEALGFPGRIGEEMPDCEDDSNIEKNLFSQNKEELPELLTERGLCNQTIALKTPSTVPLEVKVSGDMEKGTEKNCSASYPELFIGKAKTASALEFCTGHGERISVSEASLFKARKWLSEGDLEGAPRKADASESMLFSSAADKNMHFKVSPSKNILTLKMNRTDSHERQGAVYPMDGYISKASFSNSKGNELSNRLDLNTHCDSEYAANICNDSVVVNYTAGRKGSTDSQLAFHNLTDANKKYSPMMNEDTNVQSLPDPSEMCSAQNVINIKTSTGKTEFRSTHFELKPATFSPAKTIPISPEAVIKPKEISPTTSNVRLNIGTESEICPTEIVAGNIRTLGSPENITFPHLPGRESNYADNAAMYIDTAKKEENIADKQALKKTQSLFANTSFEVDLQKSHCQANFRTYDFCQAELGKLPPLGALTRMSQAFNTASGKPVRVSDASLKKAKQVFSAIENHSERLPFVTSFKDTESHPEKVMDESNPNRSEKPQVLQKHSSGFRTGSGKQVRISESALERAKGVLMEFDELDKDDNVAYFSKPNQDVLKASAFHSRVDGDQAEGCILSFPTEKDLSKKLNYSNYYVERKSSEDSRHIQVSRNRDEQLSLVETGQCDNGIAIFKSENLLKIDDGSTLSSRPVQARIDVFPPCSKATESALETEAASSTKAFMEDELMGLDVARPVKQSLFTYPNDEGCIMLHPRTGKRRFEEHDSHGEPSIKRKLLPEFDKTMGKEKSSLKASRSTPEGTMKDRRMCTNHVPLKPVSCGPFSLTKERQEMRNPNLTAPNQEFLSKPNAFQHHTLGRSSSNSPVFRAPFYGVSANKNEKMNPQNISGKPAKVFVPPFKTKAHACTDKQDVSKKCQLQMNKQVNKDGEQKSSLSRHDPGVSGSNTVDAKNDQSHTDSANQETIQAVAEHGEEHSDTITNLQRARELQEMRIEKKQRQRILPQMGRLYLAKTSGHPRLSLKTAVEGRAPSKYSTKELYMCGVSKHCLRVNSKNAESFQFCSQDCFSRECWSAGNGVQLADGGWLIPTNAGKAGKEEFYRALCDTPGVDSKLISRPWVFNHYRWIIWKLAAMEVTFPKQFANRCLTPERVLLQLKYRYDVEIDKSQRSAIKKITERDDSAAKTLVLCISEIISPSTSAAATASKTNNSVLTQKEGAVIHVTDGWYSLRALLDPPLLVLLQAGKLMVGQKIVLFGAELVGPSNACTPLEAPEDLMLKISANSTRPARWYAKLGFQPDPRPFPLSLSSLFKDGGNVGCVDVVIQRAYPTQWMEKTHTGSYVFRNERAEEKEASKHAESQQKKLEALYAKIQDDFEKQEDAARRQDVKSRVLTRKQVRALQDGAELYEAVKSVPDPAYIEAYFSKEQLKALSSHRQMLSDQKQAQIEMEFRKALELAEEGEEGWARRDVTAIWKLRVVDYRKPGKDAAMLNIWRPLSDMYSLLKEGSRYRIYHTAPSQSKSRSGRASVQLTATKKTQYQLLPASHEILFRIYRPREVLQFGKLLDPALWPPWTEMDLVGFVISVTKRAGLAPLVYLSDECHNLLAIKFWTDLNEDTVKPHALIAASNLQWKSETTSGICTLCAGELSAISANPKEIHFQETFNKLKSTIQDVIQFCSHAENKLRNVLLLSDPSWSHRAADGSLEPPTPHGRFDLMPPKSEAGPSPAAAASALGSGTLTPQPGWRGAAGPAAPKTCKKRKALEYLSRIPSPPPVSPLCASVSPALKKAFQPPRCCGIRPSTPVQRPSSPREGSAQSPPPLEGDLVTDEELASINTQVLLAGLAEDNTVTAGPPGLKADAPDSPLEKGRLSPNCSAGADLAGNHADEARGMATSQQKLRR